MIKNTSGHSGVAIYDLEKSEYIYQYQSDKHFVPASNVKIYSFYAALKTFKDSIPTFKYVYANDTLHFEGMGDPTFLHPDFQKSTSLDFLKKARNLVYHVPKSSLKNLGYGWAWDDYSDYYAVERSALPMYGNIARAQVKSNTLSVNPPIFSNSFAKISTNEQIEVQRILEDNVFRYSAKTLEKDAVFDIPFKTSSELVKQLLTDTLHKSVLFSDQKLPGTQYFYGSKLDTVLRKMMYESDNFLAEQILLSAGQMAFGSLDDNTTKKYLDSLLSDFNIKPKIVDGSGLSRHNLITPEMNIQILNNISKEINIDSLKTLWSVGGKTGNLKHIFKQGNPYIVAKSGSMQGVYCLSGFIKSEKNKWFAFSVMNNNFTESAREMRINTEAFLNKIRKKL